jgi:hypothetical protein
MAPKNVGLAVTIEVAGFDIRILEGANVAAGARSAIAIRGALRPTLVLGQGRLGGACIVVIVPGASTRIVGIDGRAAR